MRDPDILETIYRAAVIDGASLNELRRTYGGQRVWLRETPMPDSEQRRRERERILEDLRRLPVRQAAARHGISRTTAWRLRKLG